MTKEERQARIQLLEGEFECCETELRMIQRELDILYKEQDEEEYDE